MKTIRRRRHEGKTDYKARLHLLKSEKLRLVVRKTNRYLIAQIVESNLAQDKTLVKVTSKDLLEKGWPKENSGSLKSLAAAYLTGFMLGKSTKSFAKEVILDSGLHRNVVGSRIYALVKGAADAGLNIPHNKEILPSLERIKSSSKHGALVERLKEKL